MLLCNYKYHWLIKKLLLQCRIEKGRNSKQIEEEKVGLIKVKPCSHCRRKTLDTDRTLPLGHIHMAINTHINKR